MPILLVTLAKGQSGAPTGGPKKPEMPPAWDMLHCLCQCPAWVSLCPSVLSQPQTPAGPVKRHLLVGGADVRPGFKVCIQFISVKTCSVWSVCFQECQIKEMRCMPPGGAHAGQQWVRGLRVHLESATEREEQA